MTYTAKRKYELEIKRAPGEGAGLRVEVESGALEITISRTDSGCPNMYMPLFMALELRDWLNEIYPDTTPAMLAQKAKR